MNSIYSITTHRERPSDAAEAWYECQVCAIGWSRYGNLKKSKLASLPKEVQTFLKIKKGDLILAYATENRIGYLGEIETGEYVYTRMNIVGEKENGGFDYPNQFGVNWFKEPRDFSRKIFRNS